MNAERALEVFCAVIDQPAAERSAILAKESASVRSEVVSLLEAHAQLPAALDTGRPNTDRWDVPPKQPPLLIHGVDSLDHPPVGAGSPREVGPYRLEEQIGSGGMGVVFRARQSFPSRTVAVKLMRSAGAGSKQIHRFRNEIETLGRLQHPGIAQVYEAGVVECDIDARPWFAMELLEGTSITEYCEAHEADFRTRCALLAKVCDAVQHAHDRGVVHRDLKPANILVAHRDGSAQPKVLDFGIARSLEPDGDPDYTMTGLPIGTLPYMSPEQLAGDRPVDARSDVYSLGVLLYELLAGWRPIESDGRGYQSFLARIAEDEPRRLGHVDARFRGDLEVIAATALAKNPDHRYATARGLAEDLRRWARDLPIRARCPSRWYRASRFARRNKALVGGALATLVAIVSGLVATALVAVKALDNERAANHRAYATRMSQALSIMARDPVSAEDLLTHAAPDLRGFEWHYAMARIDANAHRLPQTFVADLPWHRQCSIAFPPGRGPLYAHARGNTVRLVDVRTGRVERTLGATGRVIDPKLCADGSTIAARVGEVDQRLVVWDVTTGHRIARFATPYDQDAAFSIREDGRIIAFGLWSDGGAILDVDRQTIRLAEPIPYTLHGPPPTPTFDRSGMVTRIGGRAFETDTARLIDTGYAAQHVWQIAHDSGPCVAVASWRRRCVDLIYSDHRLNKRLPGLRSHASSLAFCPDGSRLAGTDYAGSVLVWDVRLGLVLRGFPDRASELRFDPSGRRLAACTPRGPVEWNVEGGGSRALSTLPIYGYLIAYSPDGSTVASADGHRRVRIWDAYSGTELGEFPTDTAAKSMTFSPDGRHLLMGGPPFVAFDVATGRRIPGETPWIAPRRPPNVIRDLGAWDNSSPDGRLHVVTTRERGFVRDSNGTELHKIEVRPLEQPQHGRVAELRAALATVHYLWAPSAAIDNAGQVALGRHDGSIDFLGPRGHLKTTTQRHFGPVYGIATSPDGRRFASAGNDGTVRLWDAQSHEQVAVLRGHDSYVKAVAFRPDGKQLATTSGDGTVRLWDAERDAIWSAEGRRRAAARSAMRPRVRTALAATNDPTAVAAALRGDPALAPEQRRAALQALLQECASRSR